jgi:AcrR family transcriptional regulator
MRILRAAMNVFGRLGYVDTRVEDILREAEISRPTFYRYFKSKEDVFDAVDEVLSMSFLQTWTSAIESVKDPLEKIERGADAYLQWLKTTGPIAGVTLQESSRPGSRLGPRRDAALRIIVDVFRTETLQALGEEYDPWLFSMLQVATEHAGQLVVREGFRERDIERAKRSMMRILVGTLYDRDLPGAAMPKAPRDAKPKKRKR